MAEPGAKRAGAGYTFADQLRRRLRWYVADPFEARVRAPLREWRNRAREYRPLFAGGASGSGTSLLALSIGQHFECAGVIYESNFQVPRDSRLYVPHIDEFESVSAYQRHMTPDPSWSEERARRDLQVCYRRYCSGRGDLVVDKGPDTHQLRVEFLARCFPESHFVFIFRDPVANVEGLRRKWKTFGRDPLDETIRFYREIHERILAAAETLPGRIHAVAYEAFVERPEATLAELGRRLGLAPAAARQRIRNVPNVEGMGIRNVQGGRIGVVTDANRRARERLPAGDLERILSELAPIDERLRRAPFTLTRAPDPAGPRPSG